MSSRKYTRSPFSFIVALCVTLIFLILLGTTSNKLFVGKNAQESEAFGDNLSIDGGNLRVTTPVSPVVKGKKFSLQIQFRVPEVRRFRRSAASASGMPIVTNWDRIDWDINICGKKVTAVNNSINYTVTGIFPNSNTCLVDISVAGHQNLGDDFLYPGTMKLTINSSPGSATISGPSSVTHNSTPSFTSNLTGISASQVKKTKWNWSATKCSSSTKVENGTMSSVYKPNINKKPANKKCDVRLVRTLVTGNTSKSEFTLQYADKTKSITTN